MPTIATLISSYLKSVGITATTAGIRRVTVTGLIKSLDPQTFKDISANVFLKALRRRGLGVRRQWFLRTFKYIKTSPVEYARQATTPPATRILMRDMPIVDVNLTHKYSYQLSMDVMGRGYIGDEPGEGGTNWEDRQYWFGSDRLMSPREVITAFQERFETGTMARVEADWASLKFIRATRRGTNIKF